MRKIAILCLIVILQSCSATLEHKTTRTFANPLFSSGADPWIVYDNGFYFYTATAGSHLFLKKAKNLDDLKLAETKIIWTPPLGTSWSKDLWAPELHRINNKWYMYFAADDGKNMNHRMYVLENSSPDPLNGNWEFRGKVADPSDKWAIDGSVFEYDNSLYMVWSGWEGDVNGEQSIYIARMKDPLTFDGNRVRISKPEYKWETVGDLNNPNDVKHVNVNEGPVALQNGKKLFIIYSGSGCWTDSYCLGMISYNGKGDLLDPASWVKSPEPIFKGNSYAYSPGHNSFFKSPDGKENWILYHANPKAGQGCGRNRSPRAQKFSFGKDGTPVLGEPVQTDIPMSVPSENKRKQGN